MCSLLNCVNDFMFGCTGPSLLREGFLWLWRAGPALHCGAQDSLRGGFSCCGAQASGVVTLGCREWAQQLWRLSSTRHVGSSWTRYQTRVLCTDQQILNHQTTREVPVSVFSMSVSLLLFCKLVHLYQFLDHTYKWYYMVFLFFYFTQNDHLQVHPTKWHNFILPYGLVIVHCISVPHLLYPFICQRTFRLLPCLGYCEQS